MNLPPEDDRPLTEFLHQYRALPPPESPDLEDRLMAKVECHPARSSSKGQISKGQTVWLIPPAIAAGLVATLLGYRTLTPAQLTATEATSLESSIEANWRNTVTETFPEDNTFFPTDSTSN